MRRPSRSTVLAAAIAAPAVAAALGLGWMSLYRLVDPAAPLFGGPPPRSLAESIAERYGVEQTFAFIREGQDPNQPVAVDHEDYTEGQTVMVSPLMLAIAARDSSTVRMLLNFGGRLDVPQNRFAGCLAAEIGNDEIIEIIAAARGDEAGISCPERKPDAATPLLAWAGRP